MVEHAGTLEYTWVKGSACGLWPGRVTCGLKIREGRAELGGACRLGQLLLVLSASLICEARNLG